MAEQKSPCEGCMYYGKSTDTCDYILIADQRRPCPPGAECTVRRTTKEGKRMGKARWDTELGRLLWLEGKSDAQIAKEMGVAPNTVLHQRRRWEKTTTRTEPAAPPQEAEPVPELANLLTQKPEAKQESPTHPVSMSTPEGVYNILEEATKTKSGIEAICTADAILCLWNWDSADDLRRARAAINHLIKRLEG